jgi:hypothetical protein
MGKYYNQGWSVADTNRLASIVRRLDPTFPLDKESLHEFTLWVILNRRYRTVKLMSGFPYADEHMRNIRAHEEKHQHLLQLYIGDLTDDEWDFICELPVKEN